jgi:hypothetical protein
MVTQFKLHKNKTIPSQQKSLDKAKRKKRYDGKMIDSHQRSQSDMGSNKTIIELDTCWSLVWKALSIYSISI